MRKPTSKEQTGTEKGRRGAGAVEPEGRYVIPNLRNACLVMKELARETGGLRTADLARELALPATTALRILHTLEVEGMVRKEGGRFVLGPALIRLGASARQSTSLTEAAEPVLEALAVATDETAHVAIPHERGSLILAVADSPHPLRAASRPGFLAELHCSSTGKVFLTFLYRDRVEEVLAKGSLVARTPRTYVELASLERELAVTEARGYAVDNEEFALGVRCLAAPVRDSRGEVVAAVGITAAAVRFTPARDGEVAQHVLRAARELSRKLGAGG